MRWFYLWCFFLMPIIEIWGLITVGSWLGPGVTILLVLAMVALGVFLARREGLQAYHLAQIQLRNGELPGEAMLDGFCVLIGAVLLITPGFVTDLLGLLFFIPYTRALIKTMMKRWLQHKLATGQPHLFWIDRQKYNK